MTQKKPKALFITSLVVIALLFLQACECSHSDSNNGNDADQASQDAGHSLSENTAYDGQPREAASDRLSKDSEVASVDTATAHSLDVDGGKPDSAEQDASIPKQSKPTVTPAELTEEVLDDYIYNSPRPDQPQTTEPDSCGYKLTIDFEQQSESMTVPNFTAPNLKQREVRYFDQDGRLLLQYSDWLKTEVEYDSEGRPIMIWIDQNLNPMHMPSFSIIAIQYNSDGSAETKMMHQMADFFASCDYLLFDHRLRLTKRIYDQECDGVAQTQFELNYQEETDKPIFYQQDEEGSGLLDEKISWSYLEDGQLVKTTSKCIIFYLDVATDLVYDPDYFLRQPETVITHRYDEAGTLLSIHADYEDDGKIDSYSEYRYDERGRLLREETHIDEDSIIDLLKINTYSEDGYILTEEQRNLTDPTIDGTFPEGRFKGIEPATARVTNYTYDNASKLIQKTSEDSLMQKQETFAYDVQGRLIEQTISAEYLIVEGEIFPARVDLTCTIEYQCDNTTLSDSILHKCELNTPLYYHIFPYQTVARRKPQREREQVISFDVIPYTTLKDVLGFPWY